MHLLDTDTPTHLHAGHARVIARLHCLDDPHVGTTIITKGELLRGRIDFLLKAATGEETPAGAGVVRAYRGAARPLLIIAFDAAAPHASSNCGWRRAVAASGGRIC